MPITITLTNAGGPEVLQVQDLQLAAPVQGEVQIRHSRIGVNFVDIYFRAGLYKLPAAPAVLGLEGVGRVAAVGAGVTCLRAGDRVAYVGLPLGAYAESRNLPQERLVRLPDGVSDEMAGGGLLRGLTAQMLLRQVRTIQPGEWLLVHAAAGGLGQIVTRWARLLGARVIGTVGSTAKITLAQAAGAEAVLLHSDPGWVEQARALADGKGVHLAVDGIGGGMLLQTLHSVRPFGLAASLGQPAGPIPPVSMEQLSAVGAVALMRPSVIGYASDPGFYRTGMAELLDALAAGLAGPPGMEYQLADAARAHADLEAGRTTGSVVLVV